MDIPRFLTKFFELKDYRHFAEGRIRAGTLRSYRNVENEKLMGARLDQDDGIYSVNYSYSGDAVDVRLGNIVQIENSIGMTVENCRQNVSFNYWVFCAAVGRYSCMLHRQFLEQSSDGYIGDRRLLAYAVFDTNKLLYAIKDCLARKRELSSCLLDSRTVTYDKAVANVRAFGKVFSDRPETHAGAFEDAVFKKHKLFMPEHEFRIAIIPRGQGMLHNSAGPLFLQSSLVRGSIVELGPLTTFRQ